MEIDFIAQIKSLLCKTDADGDLTGRITLDFIPTDETYTALKMLYRPQTNVHVIIEGEE